MHNMRDSSEFRVRRSSLFECSHHCGKDIPHERNPYCGTMTVMSTVSIVLHMQTLNKQTTFTSIPPDSWIVQHYCELICFSFIRTILNETISLRSHFCTVLYFRNKSSKLSKLKATYFVNRLKRFKEQTILFIRKIWNIHFVKYNN